MLSWRRYITGVKVQFRLVLSVGPTLQVLHFRPLGTYPDTLRRGGPGASQTIPTYPVTISGDFQENSHFVHFLRCRDTYIPSHDIGPNPFFDTHIPSGDGTYYTLPTQIPESSPAPVRRRSLLFGLEIRCVQNLLPAAHRGRTEPEPSGW